MSNRTPPDSNATPSPWEDTEGPLTLRILLSRAKLLLILTVIILAALWLGSWAAMRMYR